MIHDFNVQPVLKDPLPKIHPEMNISAVAGNLKQSRLCLSVFEELKSPRIRCFAESAPVDKRTRLFPEHSVDLSETTPGQQRHADDDTENP